MTTFDPARNPLFQSARLLGELLCRADLTPEQRTVLCAPAALDCEEVALDRLLEEVTWAWDTLKISRRQGVEAAHRTLLALAQAGDTPGRMFGHKYTVLVSTSDSDELVTPLRAGVEEAVVDAMLHAQAQNHPRLSEWRYGDPLTGWEVACGRPDDESDLCYTILHFQDPQDAALAQAAQETAELLARRMGDLDPEDDDTSTPRTALCQLRHALGVPLRRLVTLARPDGRVLADYAVSQVDTATCLLHAFVSETVPRALVAQAWHQGSAANGRWRIEVSLTEQEAEPLRLFDVQGRGGPVQRLFTESAEHLHAQVQEFYDLNFPDSEVFQMAFETGEVVTDAGGHRLAIQSAATGPAPTSC